MGGVAGTAAASADAAARCLREDPMWLPHPCVPQNHHVHALLYMHGDIAFYIKCHIAAYDISILCVHFAHAVQVEPGARPRTAAGASLAHCFRSVLRPLDPRLAAFELPDLWMADIVVDPQANKYM